MAAKIPTQNDLALIIRTINENLSEFKALMNTVTSLISDKNGYFNERTYVRKTKSLSKLMDVILGPKGLFVAIFQNLQALSRSDAIKISKARFKRISTALERLTGEKGILTVVIPDFLASIRKYYNRDQYKEYKRSLRNLIKTFKQLKKTVKVAAEVFDDIIVIARRFRLSILSTIRLYKMYLSIKWVTNAVKSVQLTRGEARRVRKSFKRLLPLMEQMKELNDKITALTKKVNANTAYKDIMGTIELIINIKVIMFAMIGIGAMSILFLAVAPAIVLSMKLLAKAMDTVGQVALDDQQGEKLKKVAAFLTAYSGITTALATFAGLGANTETGKSLGRAFLQGIPIISAVLLATSALVFAVLWAVKKMFEQFDQIYTDKLQEKLDAMKGVFWWFIKVVGILVLGSPLFAMFIPLSAIIIPAILLLRLELNMLFNMFVKFGEGGGQYGDTKRTVVMQGTRIMFRMIYSTIVTIMMFGIMIVMTPIILAAYPVLSQFFKSADYLFDSIAKYGNRANSFQSGFECLKMMRKAIRLIHGIINTLNFLIVGTAFKKIADITINSIFGTLNKLFDAIADLGLKYSRRKKSFRNAMIGMYYVVGLFVTVALALLVFVVVGAAIIAHFKEVLTGFAAVSIAIIAMAGVVWVVNQMIGRAFGKGSEAIGWQKFGIILLLMVSIVGMFVLVGMALLKLADLNLSWSVLEDVLLICTAITIIGAFIVGIGALVQVAPEFFGAAVGGAALVIGAILLTILSVIGTVYLMAKMLKAMTNLHIDVKAVKEVIRCVLGVMKDIIAMVVGGDYSDQENTMNASENRNAEKKSLLSHIVDFLGSVLSGLANLVSMIIAVPMLLCGMISLGAIWVMAHMLKSIAKIEVDGKAAREKVKEVLDTQNYIINFALDPEGKKIEEDKNQTGNRNYWEELAVHVLPSMIANIFQLISMIAIVPTLLMSLASVAIIKCIAGMLFSLKDIPLLEHRSKIRENVQQVLDTADYVKQLVMFGPDWDEDKFWEAQGYVENKNGFLDAVKDIGSGILKGIVGPIMAIVQLFGDIPVVLRLMSVMASVAMVAHIADCLSKIMQIELPDRATLLERVKTIVAVCDDVAREVLSMPGGSTLYEELPENYSMSIGEYFATMFGGSRGFTAKHNKNILEDKLSPIAGALGVLTGIINVLDRIMNITQKEEWYDIFERIDDIISVITYIMTNVLAIADPDSFVKMSSAEKEAIINGAKMETHWYDFLTLGVTKICRVNNAYANTEGGQYKIRLERMTDVIESFLGIVKKIQRIVSTELPDWNTIRTKLSICYLVIWNLLFMFSSDSVADNLIKTNPSLASSFLITKPMALNEAMSGNDPTKQTKFVDMFLGSLGSPLTKILNLMNDPMLKEGSDKQWEKAPARIGTLMGIMKGIIDQSAAMVKISDGVNGNSLANLQKLFESVVGQGVTESGTALMERNLNNAKIFLEKVNSLDYSKLNRAASLFESMAKFSESIKGNFDGLANALNKKIVPILETLKSQIEDLRALQVESNEVQTASMGIMPETTSETGLAPAGEYAAQMFKDDHGVFKSSSKSVQAYYRAKAAGKGLDQIVALLSGWSGTGGVLTRQE